VSELPTWFSNRRSSGPRFANWPVTARRKDAL